MLSFNNFKSTQIEQSKLRMISGGGTTYTEPSTGNSGTDTVSFGVTTFSDGTVSGKGKDPSNVGITSLANLLG